MQHGADAVRYWAVSARLGTDAAYDTGQMKVGRRLAIKVLNASKFAALFRGSRHSAQGVRSRSPGLTKPIDRAMLAGLSDVIVKATKGFDAYHHPRALEVTERFFWSFCDDYLELVKDRAYGSQGDRGRYLNPRVAADRPRRPASAARAVRALCHRGGLVLVARRINPPRRLAPPG